MSEFYKKSYFNRRNWLMENYVALQLSPQDGMVLLMIDFLNETGQAVSIKKIAKMLSLEVSDVDSLLQSLKERNYLQITMNSRGFQFSIDPVFTALQSQKNLPLFQTFEDAFMRPLNAKETTMLKDWQDDFEPEMILYALREAAIYKKMSFSYIDAILKDLKNRHVSVDQLNQV